MLPPARQTAVRKPRAVYRPGLSPGNSRRSGGNRTDRWKPDVTLGNRNRSPETGSAPGQSAWDGRIVAAKAAGNTSREHCRDPEIQGKGTTIHTMMRPTAAARSP